MRTQNVVIVTALALSLAIGSFGRMSVAQDESETCPDGRPRLQITLTDHNDHNLNSIPHQYGYGDGKKAAKEDLRHGFAPNPGRHDEFRHPCEISRLRSPYQYGFIEGYNETYQYAKPKKHIY
jgi:hypothetical protein